MQDSFLIDPDMDDHDKVLAMVSTYGLRLEDASVRLRNTPEIVLAAVRDWGEALQYASSDLRNDLTIVKTAVCHYGPALQYASESLRDNETIVRAAIKDLSVLLQYASERLRADPDIAIVALTEWLDEMKAGVYNEGREFLAIAPCLLQSPEFAKRCLDEGLDVEAIAAASGDFTLGLTACYAQQNPHPGLLQLYSAQHDGRMQHTPIKHRA